MQFYSLDIFLLAFLKVMSKLVKKKYTQPETQSMFISDGQSIFIY